MRAPLCVGFFLVAIGCAQAVPVVGPVASCVSTVLADALKGDTVAQILADAGPTCVASAEEVIAILLGSPDPAVHATKAFSEAMASRQAIPAPPIPTHLGPEGKP